MKTWLAVAIGWMAAVAAHAAPPERVVTLGGSVTEIVYQLGQGERLVGDDLSSLYPEAATRLPRVGYYRAVPVEGVLALKPDLVLASEQAGPPEALKRLGEVGVRVVTVPDSPSVDSLKARIRNVAEALEVAPEGERMVERIARELKAVEATPVTHARAILLINRTGALLGAGGGTAANEVMAMAGLVNVLKDQQGYKPVSAEAVSALAPDLIVVTKTSLEATGGAARLLATPGLASTPAAARQRVIVMDDLLLLGMGPRLPLALTELKREAAGAMAR
ncbi:heme/hemin ABC transporter substrate-binding protein [Achromobacter denitrificans]|uniref:Helical backbone metal receptor n=1 Tax=Achromobacter denitrificans TaxID=32002 RepID=A0ABZ3FZN5_ACHDE|nr:helical backbone metal receptor [Achromobacter denitrificans]MPT39086.1 hemin ABC transporter substrate-binding protein [Achromobacter sp.]QCS64172.1 hemin ABC transporter substrate-binding protein [Achromobacter denitrificans]GFN29515.1 hemin-binding protein [Achromobacter denitrificans]